MDGDTVYTANECNMCQFQLQLVYFQCFPRERRHFIHFTMWYSSSVGNLVSKECFLPHIEKCCPSLFSLTNYINVSILVPGYPTAHLFAFGNAFDGFAIHNQIRKLESVAFFAYRNCFSVAVVIFFISVSNYNSIVGIAQVNDSVFCQHYKIRLVLLE